MSEGKKRDRKTDEAKCRFGRFWSTFAAVAIICCLVWKIILWNCRSADDQLAAINADRVITEYEDAGVAYRKLAEDYLPLPMDPISSLTFETSSFGTSISVQEASSYAASSSATASFSDCRS